VKSRIDRDNDKSRFLQSQLDAFSDIQIVVEVPRFVTPNCKKRPSPAYQSTTLTKLYKPCGDETRAASIASIENNAHGSFTGNKMRS
jgi:hypothetical protein